ncbi:MAG: tRNA (N6-isopentenyl adenosine(37)-C2)-methylthiotransferase MiaB [Nitrospinae bacterium]|nr:tRNA (N6-isopentenyl adenosine(37)-C2)-methylthiotransferase MiaB [Nitrospinota bacterium]
MRTNGKKKLAFLTLGCQMNQHDSEWIAGVLADGYEVIEQPDDADFLVINTCSVRDKAEHKFFSLLGRLRPLKARRGGMIIGVAGCVAQDRAEEIIAREPMVDLVFGTRAIASVPEMLARFAETGQPQVNTADTSAFDEYPMTRQSAASAWVSIMQGCDNHCSYCIVPHTRGPERSRPIESVLREVSALAEQGYREIILLGQNVNSYGRGLDPETDFPALLERVASTPGIRRVRFVTSHPKDLSDRLIEVMGAHPHVCPALHLPIQSGSDRILPLMKRGYTVAHYFDRVERLKERVPDLSLTADVMVGFPGETDADFLDTLRAVERAEYDNIFLFKFSPRQGTPAAAMDQRYPNPSVAQERFERISQAQKAITRRRYARFIGREVELLVEGTSKRDPAKYTGRLPQNILAHFSAGTGYTGQFIRVKIMTAGQYSLSGTLLDNVGKAQ